ncbi:MAG TPA: LacI family DNA-binding transcriptional regulator [Chloroflexota bacterium]|nr:LacI family DNA-binding transcriptional regulator [Chloroflexota bacterium]
MTAKLRDVAKMAGVSMSTVSRALNGDQGRSVALETRERILDVARQLKYEPNDAAQRLVRRVDSRVHRTGRVGLILGQAYKFSDPFWSRVLDGVTEELIRQEYHLHFALTIHDLERQSQSVLRDIDGLILLGVMQPPDQDGWSKPAVSIEGADDRDRWEHQLLTDVIAIEKRRAMYRLVAHLAALGHRRLAFLGPSPSVDERAEAFTQALAHHDPSLEPAPLFPAEWSAEDGYQATKSLLAAGHRPDALVCGCDTLAIGAMRAAKERGLRLPDDLAITGFDDISFAPDLDPPLTTIHVPKELLGELAVRKLIERTAHPTYPPVVQTVQTTLVVRGSCGAPRGAAPIQTE